MYRMVCVRKLNFPGCTLQFGLGLLEFWLWVWAFLGFWWLCF